MKTSSHRDPAVTLSNPQQGIRLLHAGGARQINSILTPQDTKPELKPDTCHVLTQAFVACKMVSDAQLFDIIEETRRTRIWIGKGRCRTLKKDLRPPTV